MINGLMSSKSRNVSYALKSSRKEYQSGNFRYADTYSMQHALITGSELKLKRLYRNVRYAIRKYLLRSYRNILKTSKRIPNLKGKLNQ